MLGRLLGTHAFATQPEAERTGRFAERLVEALEPEKKVLEIAEQQVRRMMDKQSRETGFKTEVAFPW